MSTEFAVVIPAYNAQDTLAETLDSVFSQTLAPCEVIVADDGSTDGTADVIKRYQQTHDTLCVVTQENAGTAAAYNAAVAASSAPWVVMVSADDILLEQHLENIDATLNTHPNAELITTNGYYLDKGAKTLVYERAPCIDDSCSLTQLIDQCFFAVGAAFTREVFDVVKGFRENMFAEDYYFFLSALAWRFEHAYAPLPTAVHRRSVEQKSNKALVMRTEELQNFEQLLQEFELRESEQQAIARKIAHLKKNIALRKALYRVLSEERAERLIRKLGR